MFIEVPLFYETSPALKNSSLRAWEVTFSQYKTNKTKNKQIKYGTIQKVCRLHNGIFQPIQLFVTLCQFSLFYSPNFNKKL